MNKVGPRDLSEIVKKGLKQEVLLIDVIENIDLFLCVNTDNLFRLEFIKPPYKYEGHDRVLKIYMGNKFVGFYVIELEGIDKTQTHAERWIRDGQIIRSNFMYGLTMPIRKFSNKFDGFLKFALEIDSFWFAPKIIINTKSEPIKYPNDSDNVKPDNDKFRTLNFNMLDNLIVNTQKHIFIDGSPYDKYVSFYRDNTSKIEIAGGIMLNKENTLPKIKQPYDALLNYFIKCALIKGDKVNNTDNFKTYINEYGKNFE